MTVYIGNAVGDEHGKASGGKPGDQTGREVKIQAWYLNKKGWRVFRPCHVAEKLVYDMKAACENDNIGYSQEKRNTLYNVSKPYGFDCAKVETPCECDCSSLVRVCILYSGIDIGNFNTSTEPSKLLATGEFVEMVGTEYTDSYKKLKAGDILCTKTKGHTAIVLNDGPNVDPPEPITPDIVIVNGKSVWVRDADSTKGKKLFVAHKGQEFELIDVAPSGWYHILTAYPEAYITNKTRYTELV